MSSARLEPEAVVAGGSQGRPICANEPSLHVMVRRGSLDALGRPLRTSIWRATNENWLPSSADESGTLAALRRHRSELIDPLIGEHGGRVVKVMGDGLLVEFPSVVAAVETALAVQEGMVERIAGVPEEGRIRFRIGVNLGDVIVEGEDILGDGVNVAARLQAISEPGGIAISRRVYEEVRDRLHSAFEAVGEQTLKNIARPVEVWRWTPAATSGPSDQPTTASAMPPSGMPAVAVLPFANLSADPEQEYFSDGLTEDIITALTYWRSFPVIARNSCFAYKNRPVNATQAGRELGAGYIVEGSIRKGAGRVRISVLLIDASTGHHVWAEKYDRELTDIFEVQDEMVQCIAAHVAPELVVAGARRLDNRHPEDLEAWELCLRGLPLVRRRTKESIAEGRKLFQRAVEVRPDYANAHAGLAMSYSMEILIGAAEDRFATANLAKAAARKAIECDEASSFAHHELSTAYQWLNRIDDALSEARISVELNPNDAYALHALGNKSDLAGDPSGIALMEKAQRLNPADAQLHSHLAFLARAYVNASRYEAAIERARQAIRRQPDYAPAHYILAIAFGHLGRLEEARAALDRCDEISPGFVEARRSWQPYVDTASNERLRDGLRAIRRGSGGELHLPEGR